MAGYTLESFTHSLIHHFTTRVHYTTSPSPPPTHSFFIYCLTYAFIQIIQNSRIEPGHIAYAVTPLYNHYSTVIHDIHCPKSYQNFRDVTCNVEENEILHEIFRLVVVSRFPCYISCYISEYRLPLGQCESYMYSSLYLSEIFIIHCQWGHWTGL